METRKKPKGAPNRSSEPRRAIHIPFSLILLLIFLAVTNFSNGLRSPADHEPTPKPAATSAQKTAKKSTKIPATNTPRPSVTAAPKTDAPAPSASALLDHNEWYGTGLRYYYQQLSKQEQQVFALLYDGISKCRSEIPIQCTRAQIDRVLHALHMDAPELFHYDSSGITYSYDDNSVISYRPNYLMTASEYEKICSHIHGVISSLKARIPRKTSEFDTEYLINCYIVDHCEYLDAGDTSTAYADACLYKGKAQCSAYAGGMLLLLRAFGIESLIVHSGTHAWNVVKINGSWYNLDCTWNDHPNVPYSPNGNRYFGWLNVPDRLLTDPDHRPILKEHNFTTPRCVSLKDNYAYREGIYIAADTADPAGKMKTALTQAHKQGKDSVCILIDDPNIQEKWDDIFNRFYYVHQGYGWSLYHPSESHIIAFAVWHDN